MCAQNLIITEIIPRGIEMFYKIKPDYNKSNYKKAPPDQERHRGYFT
jgi:hypothetical protein